MQNIQSPSLLNNCPVVATRAKAWSNWSGSVCWTVCSQGGMRRTTSLDRALGALPICTLTHFADE